MEKRVIVKGNGRINWRTFPVMAKLGEPEICEKCGKRVYPAKTQKGKKMKIEYAREGVYYPHFNHCIIN